jgi:hypothetical protein
MMVDLDCSVSGARAWLGLVPDAAWAALLQGAPPPGTSKASNSQGLQLTLYCDVGAQSRQ